MPKTKPQKPEIIIILIGILIFLNSLFLNAGALDFYLEKTGSNINELSIYLFYIVKNIILFIGLALICLGFVSLLYRERKGILDNKKFKEILYGLFVFLISVFVCLILFELILQLLALRPSTGFQQPDELLHHMNIPNLSRSFVTSEWNTQVNMNSVGLRDSEILGRDEFDKRVLVLGDSFTWGWGVNDNETFSALIEQELNSGWKKVDVINAGALSYSPTLQYLYLKEQGINYKPDIVVVNFDMSDVQDDYLYEQNSIFDSEGNLIAVSPSYSEKHAFSLKMKSIEFIYGLMKKAYSKIPGKSELNSKHMTDIKYSRYFTTLNEYEGVEENEAEHIERSLKYIGKIKELCDENNITLIVSTYPYGHQISESEWVEGRWVFGFGNNKVYSDRTARALEDYCRQNQIDFVNMFDDFKDHSGDLLFFPYDGHFTTSGHKLASEILLREIKKVL